MILLSQDFNTKLVQKYLLDDLRTISLEQFIQALTAFGIKADEQHLKAIFDRYDSNKDHQLTISDVADMFTP